MITPSYTRAQHVRVEIIEETEWSCERVLRLIIAIALTIITFGIAFCTFESVRDAFQSPQKGAILYVSPPLLTHPFEPAYSYFCREEGDGLNWPLYDEEMGELWNEIVQAANGRARRGLRRIAISPFLRNTISPIFVDADDSEFAYASFKRHMERAIGEWQKVDSPSRGIPIVMVERLELLEEGDFIVRRRAFS